MENQTVIMLERVDREKALYLGPGENEKYFQTVSICICQIVERKNIQVEFMNAGRGETSPGHRAQVGASWLHRLGLVEDAVTHMHGGDFIEFPGMEES